MLDAAAHRMISKQNKNKHCFCIRLIRVKKQKKFKFLACFEGKSGRPGLETGKSGIERAGKKYGVERVMWKSESCVT